MNILRIAIRRLGFWSRVSAIGLALVLLAGAVYGPWFSNRADTETAASTIATQLDLKIESANDALSGEEIYEERYKYSPTELNLNMRRHYAEDIESALNDVRLLGDASEQKDASAILAEHRAYVVAADQMFADGASNDLPRSFLVAERSKVDAMHAGLARHVSATKSRLDTARVTRGSEFQTTSALISRVAIAISFIGLTFLCVFLYVLEKYRKQTAEAHRAELTRFEEAALTDNLTSLGNHRAFQEDLRREFSRATRHDETLSLALIDVDDLKVVNDSNGHQRGDELLIGLAKLLQLLRVEDRAYRIGGDEFAVLLTNTRPDDAEKAMERLRLAVQDSLGGATISIGIASCRGAERDPDVMRGQADAALYAAKRGRRNVVESFREETDGMWLFSTSKVRNLRQLIADGEVAVALQPIWDLALCDVMAYEALARPAKKYGFAGPQDAFDLAERVGTAHELDAVCRDAILARSGDLPSDSLLFINICPQSLDHESFKGPAFAELVSRAGLAPNRVVVEITERAVIRIDSVVAAARELQRFGFLLALDDTGAGNSGLEMLSKLPLNFVKIDRTIIVKAANDPGSRGVLAGIIAISRAIGAFVIAEGIEDEELLRLVYSHDLGGTARGSGVNGVQGYLLGRPSEVLAQGIELDSTRALLRIAGTYSESKARAREAGIV